MVVVQGLLVVGAVCSVVVGRVGIGGAGCLRCMHISFGVVGHGGGGSGVCVGALVVLVVEALVLIVFAAVAVVMVFVIVVLGRYCWWWRSWLW